MVQRYCDMQMNVIIIVIVMPESHFFIGVFYCHNKKNYLP